VSGFTATAVHAARDAAGSGVVCFPAGTYSGNLSATVANQTWKLSSSSVIQGAVSVTAAGFELNGGSIQRSSGDRWSPSVSVRANDVTIANVRFAGGGTGINVQGRDRARIAGNTFTGLSGSAISLWGDGVGADDTVIESNTISQSITYRVSPITSRGNESNTHGSVQNARTIIRNNVVDQGAGDVGWFGMELKQSSGAVITGNSIKGGSVLVSLPESDAVVIRGNTFDMRGSPYWGVEIANAHDSLVENNTFVGGGTSAGDHAVSLNSGSLRSTVRHNSVRDTRTLFDVSGDHHSVTDNCLTNVTNVYEYRSSGGSNITFARNGPCG
jgi:hypothetical protein